MRNIKIHPAAESYRLMRNDELAALAEDIEAHGLIDPIIMGRVNGAATEALVDGRNRLHACEIARVEPKFQVIEFPDEDAVRAFVKSRSERRDLSKGERAMALAMLYPKPERGKKSRILDNLEGNRKGWTDRLYQARSVLGHSPELAAAVRDGTIKLDEALDRVKNERRDLESTETKLAILRSEAPDLAELVEEDRIALAEATAALEQRKVEAVKIEQSKRDTLIRVAATAYSNVLALGVAGFTEDIEVRLDDKEFRAELLKFMRLEAPQFSTIDDGASALKRLVATLKEG